MLEISHGSKRNEFWEKNCIVGGDFNTTLHQKEKRGGALVRDTFKESMEDLISSLHLLEIKPSKMCFT